MDGCWLQLRCAEHCQGSLLELKVAARSVENYFKGNQLPLPTLEGENRYSAIKPLTT